MSLLSIIRPHGRSEAVDPSSLDLHEPRPLRLLFPPDVRGFGADEAFDTLPPGIRVTERDHCETVWGVR